MLPTHLLVRGRTLPVSSDTPMLMGVLNASPDSFFDGGLFPTYRAQLDRALAMVQEGCGIIDVGGESAITGVKPSTPEAERELVVPLVRALVAEGIDVSVDTWKREVAAAVLDVGAVMINDVSGLADHEIARQCASHGSALTIMHTRARPKHKDFPHQSRDEVVLDVRTFLEHQINVAVSVGLSKSSIVIDPGPDFGKTPAQTVAVLSHLEDLHSLGCPILLAVSRKDFLGALTGTRPRDRLPATLAAIAAGVARGAGILRVHDVAAVRQYLRIADALAGKFRIQDDLRLPPGLRRETQREPSDIPVRPVASS